MTETSKELFGTGCENCTWESQDGKGWVLKTECETCRTARETEAQERITADQAAAVAKEANRVSAINKLKVLGLTDDEVSALRG